MLTRIFLSRTQRNHYVENKIFMTRTRKTLRNRKEDNNNEPEINNEASTSDNLFPEVELTTSNYATSSKVLSTNNNVSPEIPLEIKQYINAAFKKQTLEIKALFQNFQSSSSLPPNAIHDLDSDTDANINNRDKNRLITSDIINNIDDPSANFERKNTKRPATDSHDDNINNNINNKKNRISRLTQGEQLHTNTSTTLRDIEHMLRDRTQENISNATSSLPISDGTTSRFLSHVSVPNNEQNYSLHSQDNTAAPISSFPWLFQAYDPIDYRNPSYDPGSELDQIKNPIAKETERTRLWWTTNFKKDGWNRILNKPSKPANIPRSIWQTIAYNQFMELTLLSQNSVENFTKAHNNNNSLETNFDDDTRTLVIIQPLQATSVNNDPSYGQARKAANNLYLST